MNDNLNNNHTDNNKDNSLPTWFTEPISKPIRDKFESVSISRQDTYTALNLYQSHVKFTSTLLLSILAAALAILTFRAQGDGGTVPRVLEQAVSVLLFLNTAIGAISIFVVTRYYDVYISELVAGAHIHYHIGLHSYEWYERLINKLKAANKGKKLKEISMKEFIGIRARSCDDSHFWYSVILAIVGLVCAIGGVWLLMYAPFSTDPKEVSDSMARGLALYRFRFLLFMFGL